MCIVLLSAYAFLFGQPSRIIPAAKRASREAPEQQRGPCPSHLVCPNPNERRGDFNDVNLSYAIMTHTIGQQVSSSLTLSVSSPKYLLSLPTLGKAVDAQETVRGTKFPGTDLHTAYSR